MSDRPRPLVVRLLGWSVVAALLYAGASWALIAGAGSTKAFRDGSLSVDALLDVSRRRLTLLRAARSLPGFGKRASRASRAVLDAASRALRARKQHGRRVGHALLALDPRQLSGYAGKRQLCSLGQLETLGALDSRDHRRLDAAALGAAVLGWTHRSAWLQERVLAGGVEYIYRGRRLAERLMLADYRGRAVSALQGFIAKAKDSRTREELQELLCVQLARAGRDREAAALPKSQRCQAVRAWQAALSGRHELASRLAGELDSSRSMLVGGLLLRLAIHAEAGRWTALAALYQREAQSRFTFGDAYAEPMKFFNDIYSPPLPLSLTRRLLRRVERRMMEPSLPPELLPRLLFVRARQLLLAGRARPARALLRRVRRMAPDYERGRMAWPSMLLLLDGPGPALAALREDKKRRPLQEATYLTLLGRHREARSMIDALPRCEGVCRLLEVAVARGLGDQAKLDATKKALEAQRNKPGGSDATSELVVKLLSPPRGRALGPWTLSNVTFGLWEKLVFLRLVDASGAETRQWVRASLCQLDHAAVDGTMLGIYVLEEIARRNQDEAALTRLAAWRRRVGRMYERAAELWLRRVPK